MSSSKKERSFTAKTSSKKCRLKPGCRVSDGIFVFKRGTVLSRCADGSLFCRSRSAYGRFAAGGRLLHSFVGKYADTAGIVVGNVPECYCSKCQKSCSRYCLLATKRLQVYLDTWFYSYAKTTNIVILF